MKRIEVEAAEDRSRIQRGHAVILLSGIDDSSEAATFTLRLLDADGVTPEAAELFGRELTPLETIVSAAGLALTLGPDITGNAALRPGVAVEITLAQARSSGIFLWPAVTPPAVESPRPILLEPWQEATFKFEPAPEVPHVLPHEGTPELMPELMPESTLPSLPMTLPDIEPLQPSPANRKPATQSPRQPATAHAPEPIEPTPRDVAPTATPPLVLAPARSASSAPATLDASPARALAPEPAHEHDREPDTEPALQPSTERATITNAAPRGAMPAATVAAFAFVVVIAAQAVALKMLDLRIAKRAPAEVAVVAAAPAPALPATPAPPVPAAIAPPPAPRPPAAAPARASLYDVIAAGPRSPRGTPGEGVPPAKALQTAHALLHGAEAERDPEEAAYWLKHYLAGAVGTEHARIALTQLGSAYAQPLRGGAQNPGSERGARNFAAAKVVWELAAAFGDTVAMCFLGAMHEHGLGLPVSSDTAAAWYARAALAGRTCAKRGDAR